MSHTLLLFNASTSTPHYLLAGTGVGTGLGLVGDWAGTARHAKPLQVMSESLSQNGTTPSNQSQDTTRTRLNQSGTGAAWDWHGWRNEEVC